MNTYFRRILARLTARPAKAPGTNDGELARRLVACEAELQELRGDIDELRRDSLRIAELYDLVFERLKGENR